MFSWLWPGKADNSKATTSTQAPAACPVDHAQSSNLSQHRVTSSIPRWHENPEEKSNWVYPSTQQFYQALERKQRDPNAKDMPIIVPIHNEVNERAWSEVLKWELPLAANKEDVKLVSFKGRPKDISPRAWFKSLIGYQRPFDRHDWIVDRAGIRTRYVIDFYNGKVPMSFFLDVRPAIDNLDCVRMRVSHFFGQYFDNSSQQAIKPS